MSTNRHIRKDQANTEALINGKELDQRDSKTNWLGPRISSGAAGIDQLLLKGATLERLERERGAVNQHLRHLELEHGLHVVNNGGLLKFERAISNRRTGFR